MIVLKVATVLIVALAVRAEKKIELEDIEEDNLRSEKEKDYDKSDGTSQNSGPSGQGLVPLEFLKSGFFRHFENPTAAPQQQRYVHQYAVTEPPERPQPVQKVQYAPPATQQATVGYLSNVPMQIYLVPQYYSEQPEQPTKHYINTQYQQPASVSRVSAYQTAPEAVQTQTNYIEVPTYTAPTSKPYTQQYTPAVTYVSHSAHPTHTSPQGTVTPAVTYQVPVVQYTSGAIQPTSASKTYYQCPQYSETNSVDGHYDGHYDDRRQYITQTEVQYRKPVSEFPRHYNSRAPYRDDYRGSHTNSISELPHPNPLLLKASPPHLAHIPKVLPSHRPYTKPVYQPASGIGPSGFSSQSHDFGPFPFKRRPTSLLDSYIPSSVQVEYLKRGLAKDPLALYDALASGRLPHPIPRHYERGFLPNQMYHTAAGGVTFGHHKRALKSDKPQHE